MYSWVWPFRGSRNRERQSSYPVQNPKTWRLSRDPDPLDWISPDPPIAPRVTSPYSQNSEIPPVGIAAQSENILCANRCDPQESGTHLALRADAGDGRRTAIR